MSDWVRLAREAADAARNFALAAKVRAGAVVAPDGRIDAAVADREQRLVHGFAWIATTVEALAATAGWAERSSAAGRLGEMERLVLRVGFGEYLAQLLGGVPMSQNEFVRPGELGLGEVASELALVPAVKQFLEK